MLKTFLAMLCGFLLGAAIYHPHPVKAGMGVNIKEVHPGYNLAINSDEVIGFSCAGESCYVLSK